MRVLLPIRFSSPNGGLHENLRFCCRALRDHGGKATVICPPGPFAESLEGEGFDVHETGFADLDADLALARSLGKFDLIHTTAGAGRRIAVPLARESGTPMVMTIHGCWGDRNFTYADVIRALFCVSPEIVTRFEDAKDGIFQGRVHYLPNAVDTELFGPSGRPVVQRRAMRIIVPSRFRWDKRKMLTFLPALWQAQARSRRPRAYTWTLVGEGEELPGLLQQAAALEAVCGEKFVKAKPWMPARALRDEMLAHDCAVAPGRSAMEAMACGLPTIALGSAGCAGLMDAAGLPAGRACNFGGYGTARISVDEAWETIAALKRDAQQRAAIGATAAAYITEHFGHDAIGARLIEHYGAAAANRGPLLRWESISRPTVAAGELS